MNKHEIKPLNHSDENSTRTKLTGFFRESPLRDVLSELEQAQVESLFARRDHINQWASGAELKKKALASLEAQQDTQEWQIKAIEQGVEAAEREKFASEDQTRRAFSKWGVYDSSLDESEMPQQRSRENTRP